MVAYQFMKRESVFNAARDKSLPVYAVTQSDLESDRLDPRHRDWARAVGFRAESGSLLLLPGSGGQLSGALFGLGKTPPDTPYATGKLARTLPAGMWHVQTASLAPDQVALGFGLGSYRFEAYRKADAPAARLVMPDECDGADVKRVMAGFFLARDLINMPANDMGPDQLEAAFRALAGHYHGDVSVIRGDELLSENYPLIHCVGRASADAPRLMTMRWGKTGARKVTLVGKGVCFDTGGLDIKPSASMALMKKDMGGAANVMGLALMIMDAKLDIDLTVIIPVVENSIAGNAFRPGDIYRSRAGLTVQIDNTDAEGRLILADALAKADEDEPSLLIDMATLTGAARVALGPEVPPFFTDSATLATAIEAASLATADPVWRLPLHKGYEKDLNAKIADLTNAPSGGMAGAITAALFLKRFVRKTSEWVHFDIYGWAPAERPHSPVGGEAQAIHALYRMIGDMKAD
jgi:leucyl aminopeptidase